MEVTCEITPEQQRRLRRAVYRWKRTSVVVTWLIAWFSMAPAAALLCAVGAWKGAVISTLSIAVLTIWAMSRQPKPERTQSVQYRITPENFETRGAWGWSRRHWSMVPEVRRLPGQFAVSLGSGSWALITDESFESVEAAEEFYAQCRTRQAEASHDAPALANPALATPADDSASSMRVRFRYNAEDIAAFVGNWTAAPLTTPTGAANGGWHRDGRFLAIALLAAVLLIRPQAVLWQCLLGVPFVAISAFQFVHWLRWLSQGRRSKALLDPSVLVEWEVQAGEEGVHYRSPRLECFAKWQDLGALGRYRRFLAITGNDGMVRLPIPTRSFDSTDAAVAFADRFDQIRQSVLHPPSAEEPPPTDEPTEVPSRPPSDNPYQAPSH